MFDYIAGDVAGVTDGHVVIDCGGVGFSLAASGYTCAEASRKKTAKLYTYLAVREDALELYGFISESERELFLNLIGVSGVGPKLAVTVLGGMNPDRLKAAIASGDVAALSTVKGVGKKTAERIALELKGKIEYAGGGVPDTSGVTADENAVLALVSLGYQRQEAESAVKKVTKSGMSTEEIIRAALAG